MWNQEKTISLIEDLHSTPCLWEVMCVDYKNRNTKVDAYDMLSKKYKVSAADIERKIQALKNQFRREHKKIMHSQRSGASPKQINWFGYQRLLFLLPGYESRGSRSTEETEEKIEDTSIDVKEENSEDITESDSNATETAAMVLSPVHDQHNEEIVNHFTTFPVKRKEFISPLSTNTKKNGKADDSNAAEAFNAMKTLADTVSKRDEYTVYGEHIANKLRNSGRSKMEIAIAQNEIDNVCFKLTMGGFSHVHSIAYSPLNSRQPTAVSHSTISSHQSTKLQQ